ncbi:uncharacterized protein LOC106089998 [Stomoxys calcitrans]|uniref:Secreted protein n=1 Tax=Stomoxys calcitrans TaxID=35570 RepID=A0A1I8NR73_STOCA|nr:uncharacterized protein LOC106089998 [Stomoxys calcitrans]
MFSQFYKQVCVALIIGLILVIHQTDAKCGECGTNGIACINSTNFHICFGADPDKSLNFQCPTNKICTRLGMKCVEPGMGVEPDCGSGLGCATCDGDQLFTCTSRTTYAMCQGAQVSKTHYSCPSHMTCDTRTKEICVDECHRGGDEPVCNLDKPM